MPKEYIAGVSFADDVAQVAVLKIKKNEILVVYLEEFKDGKTGGLWFLESLLAKRKTIFKKVHKVSIALDSSSVFMHLFPMDSSLNQVEQNVHVQWELSNFIPAFNPKEYINDVHVLRTHAQEHVLDMFVVSTQKLNIFRMQELLRENKYELHIVDTNHLCGQYSLLVNYPEVKASNVVLSAVGQKRVDIGILRHGRLHDYHYCLCSSPEDAVRSIEEYMVEHRDHGLYMYGNGMISDVMNELSKHSEITATKLNPFRRLPISSSFREFNMFVGQEHRFAACIGVALRKE